MKYVYFFGADSTEGKAEMKNVLGGKGANLAEMCRLGIPVPPGFTISTEACNNFYNNSQVLPDGVEDQVRVALKKVEKIMDAGFGDPDNPLLVSVRSGARASMPGMMETVLNVGLTSKTIPGLISKTGNPRFVYDAYRRLITMYADVVMEKAAGIEVEDGNGIRHLLDDRLEKFKEYNGLKNDSDLNGDQLIQLTEEFKKLILDRLGKNFPDDPFEQLWGGITAVFKSWNGRRAVHYRRIERLPDHWGTAVNIQSMVFGNMGDTSATGVAFTRNPATGENAFYGEWLQNAQGEDVVAGLRTPHPLNEKTRIPGSEHDQVSLETNKPELYNQLDDIRVKLEKHYRDMQDLEFTIQEGRLWMLQTRIGKRNGPAAIKMAVDMVQEGLIEKSEAVLRVTPAQLDELLHPRIDPVKEAEHKPIAKGLPAGPGGATGQIVFTADDAEQKASAGMKVVLVRKETSPEDVHGMHASEAILTSKGGMTSHAALVARGWGKCCIVGCNDAQINSSKKEMTVGGKVYLEGDWITLNGSSGKLYEGQLPLESASPDENENYAALMSWADEIRTLKIRTNADRPEDAIKARQFGAEGIGLCRTEHMFFGPERIHAMRKMILSSTAEERKMSVMELLPFQKEDFYGLLKAMDGYPVTIRLLDPPLHEFMPNTGDQIEALASELGLTAADIEKRIESLHELNPMLGHRGCRLGVSYPEITEMQAQAIFEAAVQLKKEGVEVFPEIMIPLVGSYTEFENQRTIVQGIADHLVGEAGVELPYLIGTMIELPRACLTADQIAEKAEFFSFGTNDLTQTTFGFSRDDVGTFLPDYIKNGILDDDPFQTLDKKGVGQLVEMGVNKGRSVRNDLKIGICGEHGGDPESIDFCHKTGLNYVSCSPFRVPVARFAAARSALQGK